MRKITMFDQQTNTTREITVDANSWGELHDALSNGNYESDMDVTSLDMSLFTPKIRENRLTFDNSPAGRKAELPVRLSDNNDFTLYLVANKKIKSGVIVDNEMIMEKLNKLEGFLKEIMEELDIQHEEVVKEVSSTMTPPDLDEFLED